MAEAKKEERYKFRKSRGIVLYPELINFASFLSKMLGIQITADGLDIQETHAGVNLTNKAKGAVADHPFLVKVDLSTATLTVVPGTVGGMTPLIDGNPITNVPPPTLAISGFGTEYVWLRIEIALSWGDDGALLSQELFAVYVETGTTIPDNVPSGASYHRLLATLQDGVSTGNVIKTSLDYLLCPSGEGSTTITVGQS